MIYYKCDYKNCIENAKIITIENPGQSLRIQQTKQYNVCR